MSRSLLHRNKLEEYKAYCESQGWSDSPTKGDFEVLRMIKPTKPKDKSLIVYQRFDAEHLTVFDISLKMYWAWKRDINDMPPEQQSLLL